MATYRQIHDKIWTDEWFLELAPACKLLFIYLFSNSRANLMGLYDVPIKVICFETDLDEYTVTSALEHFATDGKVYYEDGYVWIVNLFRYNANNPGSPKTQAHIRKTLDELPDIPLKARLVEYYRGIEGVSNGYRTAPTRTGTKQEQEQEQEQKQEQEQDMAAAAVECLFEFGMDTPEKVLQETLLLPQQVIDVVEYAVEEKLGAGWVRTQLRENTWHRPRAPDRRNKYASEGVMT